MSTSQRDDGEVDGRLKAAADRLERGSPTFEGLSGAGRLFHEAEEYARSADAFKGASRLGSLSPSDVQLWFDALRRQERMTEARGLADDMSDPQQTYASWLVALTFFGELDMQSERAALKQRLIERRADAGPGELRHLAAALLNEPVGPQAAEVSAVLREYIGKVPEERAQLRGQLILSLLEQSDYDSAEKHARELDHGQLSGEYSTLLKLQLAHSRATRRRTFECQQLFEELRSSAIPASLSEWYDVLGIRLDLLSGRYSRAEAQTRALLQRDVAPEIRRMTRLLAIYALMNTGQYRDFWRELRDVATAPLAGDEGAGWMSLTGQARCAVGDFEGGLDLLEELADESQSLDLLGDLIQSACSVRSRLGDEGAHRDIVSRCRALTTKYLERSREIADEGDASRDLLLSYLHLVAGDELAAIGYARRAEPDDTPEAHVLLGVISSIEHKQREAMLHLKSAVEKLPFDINVRLTLAQFQLLGGDVHAASATAGGIVNEHPDYTLANVVLGDCHMERARLSEDPVTRKHLFTAAVTHYTHSLSLHENLSDWLRGVERNVAIGSDLLDAEHETDVRRKAGVCGYLAVRAAIEIGDRPTPELLRSAQRHLDVSIRTHPHTTQDLQGLSEAIRGYARHGQESVVAVGGVVLSVIAVILAISMMVVVWVRGGEISVGTSTAIALMLAVAFAGLSLPRLLTVKLAGVELTRQLPTEQPVLERLPDVSLSTLQISRLSRALAPRPWLFETQARSSEDSGSTQPTAGAKDALSGVQQSGVRRT